MSNAGHIELLRHGRTLTEGVFRGRLDEPLSDEGHDQMAASVDGHRWSRVIASPLSRCRRFGEHLVREMGIELAVDERLAEYDFGEWEGRTIQSVMESEGDSVQRFFADPYAFTPPGGEDFRRFNERVLGAWRDLSGNMAGSADATGDNILVITHGGVILSILASVLDREGLHMRIDVPHACISRIARAWEDRPQRLLFHGVGPILDA